MQKYSKLLRICSKPFELSCTQLDEPTQKVNSTSEALTITITTTTTLSVKKYAVNFFPNSAFFWPPYTYNYGTTSRVPTPPHECHHLFGLCLTGLLLWNNCRLSNVSLWEPHLCIMAAAFLLWNRCNVRCPDNRVEPLKEKHICNTAKLTLLELQ